MAREIKHLETPKNITVNKTKVDVSIIEISISKENREKILKIFVDELKDDDLVYSYLESYGFFKSKKEYAEAVNKVSKAKPEFDKADFYNRLTTVLKTVRDSSQSEQAKNAALRSVIQRIVFNKPANSFEVYFY